MEITKNMYIGHIWKWKQGCEFLKTWATVRQKGTTKS